MTFQYTPFKTFQALVWAYGLIYTGWCFFSPYVGKNHPNWRTHIFQRGRYTTNQSENIYMGKFDHDLTVLPHYFIIVRIQGIIPQFQRVMSNATYLVGGLVVSKQYGY